MAFSERVGPEPSPRCTLVQGALKGLKTQLCQTREPTCHVNNINQQLLGDCQDCRVFSGLLPSAQSFDLCAEAPRLPRTELNPLTLHVSARSVTVT